MTTRACGFGGRALARTVVEERHGGALFGRETTSRVGSIDVMSLWVVLSTATGFR